MKKVKNDFLRQDLVELSVADFYAYDKKTGVEYFSGTLKTHELSASADTTKVKAGRDNDVQYVIPSDKEFSLTITDVWSRQDIIAKKFGGDIKVVGDGNVYKMHMPKNYTVQKDPSDQHLFIELKSEPLEGETFVIYNNKTNKAIADEKVEADDSEAKQYKITGEEGLAEGDSVFVTGFKTKAEETDMYSDITSDSKMPELFVCVEVPVYNGSNEIVMVKQYIFPRCQMNSSVTSSGASEKAEKSEESVIDILKDPTVDYLGRVIYINEADAIGA